MATPPMPTPAAYAAGMAHSGRHTRPPTRPTATATSAVGGGEVPGVDGALVAGGHDATPAAVVAVLAAERTQGRPGPVLHGQRGVEPDDSTRLADAVVELPVLGTGEPRVVPACGIEPFAAEDPEVDGVGGPGLAAGVEAGAPDPEGRGHRHRDGALEVCDALGEHDATHVGRAGLLEHAYSVLDVPVAEEPVPVNTHDDVVCCRGDGEVERLRRTARRVLHDGDPRIALGEPFGDPEGVVVAGADGEHDLHLAGVALGDDRADRLLQVPLLVEQRHDDADRRCWVHARESFSSGFGDLGQASRSRTGRNRAGTAYCPENLQPASAEAVSRPGGQSGRRPSPQQLTGHDDALDLVGALVDLGDLRVAHHPLEREVASCSRRHRAAGRHRS